MTTASTTTPPEIAAVYTPDQQAIVTGLVECQEHLKLPDKKFCEQWIKTYTETVWSKIKRGVYEAKDTTKVFGELKAALISIRRRIARIESQTEGGKFYEFDQFAALFRAVGECLKKKGQNRLLFYVAPTGAGKSRFLAELEAREQETVVLNANESWHGSYFFAALDILQALGVTGKFASQGEARREMLAAMKGRVRVLGIDEGNYFGPRSINLVKDILNETEWTVVVCLTPRDFDKMKRFYTEWSQLNRRVHCVFRYQPLTSNQVCEVLTEAGMNGDAKPASLVLAQEANAFGGMDFINRVIERLDETVNGRRPEKTDVEAAIAFVKAQLDLTPSK